MAGRLWRLPDCNKPHRSGIFDDRERSAQSDEHALSGIRRTDDQMKQTATFLSDGLNNAKNDRWNEYINVWWRHAVNADDQLRQRVAFALSEIFVISATDGLGDEQQSLSR